jgi:hypothetical protein
MKNTIQDAIERMRLQLAAETSISVSTLLSLSPTPVQRRAKYVPYLVRKSLESHHLDSGYLPADGQDAEQSTSPTNRPGPT